MDGPKSGLLILSLVGATALAGALFGWHWRERGPVRGVDLPQAGPSDELLRATYDPIHFRPAIDTAKDEQCLACHREVLEDRVRDSSPAGVGAAASLAWYQRLSTYGGAQDTFHRRHLVTPLARELMNLSCITCHRGHDPRDETPGSSATAAPGGGAGFTLRRTVDTAATCLKCHGRMNVEIMGLPGPWPAHAAAFGDSCLSCHATVRTVRHRVPYLKAEAIEAAGARNADICYGCHGGRAWYRIPYAYPRHAWPGMPEGVPDWARGRPTGAAEDLRPSDISSGGAHGNAN